MVEATQPRGLAGKARRTRVFRRARRRYANDLVDEYFDAEEKGDRARRIPIRRCNAYMETPTQRDGEDAGVGLEVAPAPEEPERAERLSDREVVWPPSPVDAAPERKLIDESMLKLPEQTAPEPTTDTADRAIRFKPEPTRVATPSASLPFPQEWRPPVGYRSRNRGLSVGGFAYGCLLGGAVAACLLLVVHVVLG